MKLQINGYWVNDLQEGDVIYARSDDGDNEVDIWRNGKNVKKYTWCDKWSGRPSSGDYIITYEDDKSTYVPYVAEEEKR